MYFSLNLFLFMVLWYAFFFSFFISTWKKEKRKLKLFRERWEIPLKIFGHRTKRDVKKTKPALFAYMFSSDSFVAFLFFWVILWKSIPFVISFFYLLSPFKLKSFFFYYYYHIFIYCKVNVWPTIVRIIDTHTYILSYIYVIWSYN